MKISTLIKSPFRNNGIRVLVSRIDDSKDTYRVQCVEGSVPEFWKIARFQFPSATVINGTSFRIELEPF